MSTYTSNQNEETTYKSFFNNKLSSINQSIQSSSARRPENRNDITLPNIPGHQFDNPYKSNFKKHQIFELKTKTCLEKDFQLPNQKEILDKEIREVEESLKSYKISGFQTTNSYFDSTKGNLREQLSIYNESYPRILPQWIKFDNKVLKYYAYFNEHVVETVNENYRSRRVHIYYYLSDDTFHIDEIKEENSGIPQGYFLKRQRVKNPQNGDFYNWRDINLGANIDIYGKVFRVYDSDEFTKQFYEYNGLSLNFKEEFVEPQKIDDITNIKGRDGSTLESRHDENIQNIAEFKEYIEVKLKGGHPNRNLKRFLENDRKVLNFSILWYDEKYDKEEKPYIMNFYLADNMIEIREIKVNNSGKDPFPYLLRKSKLPKKPKFSYCPGLLKKEKEIDYYSPKDFVLGSYINIYNRNCLIYDCDDFTKDWYKRNLNIDMDPIKMKKNPPQQIIHPIPPHMGYGSEEDSLLSVYYLNPMSKIRDMIKMFKQDKHIMRFYCKLISSVPSDQERSFILSVFCRDDTIQVYELAGKNSGRISSKFMERQKVKNPYTNVYYSPKDFIKGKDVYLNTYIFRLMESDEYTKKYMIDNPEIFKDSDLQYVISRIRQGSIGRQSFEEFCIELIKVIDPESKHYISKDAILTGLQRFDIYLSVQEIDTLVESIRMSEGKFYSMEDIFNLVLYY